MNLYTAFYKNSFTINEFGHGGEKRSFQINQLFSDVYELVRVNDLKKIFHPWYTRYWVGLNFLIRHKLFFKQCKHISTIGFHVLNFKNWLHNHPQITLFIWEPNYSYSDFYLPLLCNQHGLKVIVLPHNLESLVKNRKSAVSGLESPDWFNEELSFLKLCDTVFTISLEDQWLLSLHGIFANYLEYLPSASVIDQSINIASYRKKHQVDNFYLMLGTAHNIPTSDGMRTIINYFIKHQLKLNLVIAGFGTELLAEQFKSLPQNIKIIGSVDQKNFNDLLKKCKALLIYQTNASGLLTRIPEFMIAGIPIVANNISLRSFHNLKGLHTLNHLGVLKHLNALVLESQQTDVEAINMRYQEQINLIRNIPAISIGGPPN